MAILASGNPELLALLRRLGMPDGCQKFVLTAEVGEPVTVEATYCPDISICEVPVTKQYYLTEVCDHKHWNFKEHGRRCTCGTMIEDFGD